MESKMLGMSSINSLVFLVRDFCGNLGAQILILKTIFN